MFSWRDVGGVPGWPGVLLLRGGLAFKVAAYDRTSRRSSQTPALIARLESSVGVVAMSVVTLHSYCYLVQVKLVAKFASDHSTWNVDDWKQVLFSDELTFTTRWYQKRRVWQPVNTRYEPEYLQVVASSGRSTVNVWAVMSKDGLGPLI
ncbi:hypothetical protein MRX96_044288 [Rhipicephalus microplus]